MTIDELCRKAAVEWFRRRELDPVQWPTGVRNAEEVIASVIGPELAARDAEIERLRGQQECFLREDDPPEKHGEPIACTQCWNALHALHRAEQKRVIDLQRENAELNANLEHCANAANDPESCAALAIENAELRKDAERWRRIISLSEREGAAWSLEAAVDSEEVQGNGL